MTDATREGRPVRADAIVVAAGSSVRMGRTDKMFASIGGRPMLAWTVAAFGQLPVIDRLVVVTAAERVEELRAAPWLPERAIVVAGGPRRQESVAAGVAALVERGAGDERVVLVHDGARPAVRPDLVERVIGAADEHGAAIPVLPVVETLKRVDGDLVVATVDRDGLGAAQTPQGLRLGILRAAYARFPPDGPETFTDEAALLEACTIPVHVVSGQADNLKVTLPADLARAAAILAGAPRLAGHSDGDVVMHAVADALLGAAGLGDLGRLFPADTRTPRGIASAELLGEVVARVRDAGLRPAHVDITIVAARPRLADRLDAIRSRVAEVLALDADQVNVKASSGNLAGAEGAGRAISARAVATLEQQR